MKIDKALGRDRKRQKRNKMIVDNRGIFIIENEKRKREEKLKKKRRQKLEIQDATL